MNIKKFDKENKEMRIVFLQGVFLPNGEFVSSGHCVWTTDDEEKAGPDRVFQGDLFELSEDAQEPETIYTVVRCANKEGHRSCTSKQ